jgi:hypothetical protein
MEDYNKVVMIDGCMYFNGIRPAPEGTEMEVELPLEDFAKIFTPTKQLEVFEMDAAGNMVPIREEEEDSESEMEEVN